MVFCKIDEKMHLTGQGKIRSRDRRFVGADEILELLLHPDGKFSRSVPREAAERYRLRDVNAGTTGGAGGPGGARGA